VNQGHTTKKLLEVLLKESPGIVEENLRILTDVGFGVVAGDVVPLDAVFVQVVENSKTAFRRTVDGELGVVGLGLLVVAGVGPRAVGPVLDGVCAVGGGDLGVGGRPEPAEDVNGLQVLPLVATGEVAETSGCPDVVEASLPDEVLDPVVLCLSFDGDSVHAVGTAAVAGLQPVDLLAGGLAVSVHTRPLLVLRQVPREVVVVVAELHVLRSVLALLWNWEGEKGPVLLILLLLFLLLLLLLLVLLLLLMLLLLIVLLLVLSAVLLLVLLMVLLVLLMVLGHCHSHQHQ